RAESIRLSRLIADLPRFADLASTFGGPEDKRIDRHMEAGNALRKALDSGDAVARLAMNEIRALRERLTGKPDQPAGRTAFILISLKHPDEARLLRDVYGNAFHLISV